MRFLFLGLVVVGAVLFLAPETAHASEVSTLSFADFVEARAANPKGPVEKPEDWIAVAGIVCYVVLPIVFVVGLGFVAYELWTRNSDAALLGPAASSAWIYRGPRPPRGLVLLRF